MKSFTSSSNLVDFALAQIELLNGLGDIGIIVFA